jgi:hypothetical protein
VSSLKNIFSTITFRLFTGLIIVALSGCLNVGSNGSSTISSIAIIPESAQIPTGGTLDEQAACDAAGMTGFISKPISSAELTEKLIDVCLRNNVRRGQS